MFGEKFKKKKTENQNSEAHIRPIQFNPRKGLRQMDGEGGNTIIVSSYIYRGKHGIECK